MTLECPEIVEIAADDLCRDLRALGVTAGAALMVHASLRRIGRVPGGADSVIGSLMDVLTPETRARHRRTVTRRVPGASDNAVVEWVEIDDVADDNGRLFPAVGQAFEAAGGVRIGPLGQAEARLMSQRALVEFAVPWFEEALGGT